ncbi:MAG: VOC family protein [Mesorhizobium sp.]|nr:glyoxalase superfamily protein [Mesorhizobium sp.]MBL8575879.1 VOC family protein [Mesorhizobium sp.]
MKTAQDAKAMAKSIRQSLAEKQISVSHSEALEIVARQFGHDNWNIMSAGLDKETAGGAEPIAFTQPVPIVRIFDEARAMEFYRDFLGFVVDWQHRFHPGAPLYCQVSLGGMRLHLSEHSGDASPGCTSVVYMKGVEAWQKSLVAKNYKYNRPGLERQDWGLECEVIDPFGNRIRFMEQGGA